MREKSGKIAACGGKCRFRRGIPIFRGGINAFIGKKTVDEGVFFVQIEGNGFILLLRGDASGVVVPFDSGTKSFKNRAHRNHGAPIDYCWGNIHLQGLAVNINIGGKGSQRCEGTERCQKQGNPFF